MSSDFGLRSSDFRLISHNFKSVPDKYHRLENTFSMFPIK